MVGADHATVSNFWSIIACDWSNLVQLTAISIRNYRRLVDVTIELDEQASIFVGANNSGKTSATHVLKSFLGKDNDREAFTIYDFSAECWSVFNAISTEPDATGATPHLPVIGLDLWFDVDDTDLVHVRNLLPSLDWDRQPVGVRLEYAPVDAGALLKNYRDAYRQTKAGSRRSRRNTKNRRGAAPWPGSLTEYLRRRLSDEYKIYYYVLDRTGFDDGWRKKDEYAPSRIGTATSAVKDIDALIRVDFLDAQRHLSDSGERSRSEDLSRRLSQYYQRNLQTSDESFKAERALSRSESELNTHLTTVFEPLLRELRNIGYPGLADPHLIVRAALQPEQIIGRSPSVHYSLTDPRTPAAGGAAMTLPDRYNGLGFKNLIYMIIELLDFRGRWDKDEENRPALHLLVIEEPEAHLHAQLQQVFVQQIASIMSKGEGSAFNTQIIVTTHSSHIVYAKGFESVRYFQRTDALDGRNRSKVLNLSRLEASDKTSLDFLRKYMKLTHCDLFFADAAVLVEGNVERLLLPLMIDKSAEKLRSRYISVLEIGGAYAHVFRNLVHFLGVPTLVITDLDSVEPGADADADTDTDEKRRKSCSPYEADAQTSNPVLSKWIPGKLLIADLLAASDEEREPKPTESEVAPVRVAYQRPEKVRWHEEEKDLVGRTFEIAFAYANLEWCQDPARRDLNMHVRRRGGSPVSLDEAAATIHKRVTSGNFKKTDFALELMAADTIGHGGWKVPAYIAEGLQWLLRQTGTTEDDSDAFSAETPAPGQPT